MSALVHAISVTETLTGLPVTVIGGLAVVCRLSRPYRATSDLDIVDRRHTDGPNQLELLVAASTPAIDRTGAIVPTPLGNVNVDVLQVSDVDFHPLPDDPTGRLHVLAHAWAAETSTEIILRAQGAPERAVAMAEPGPLIAMKLQSTFDRGSAKEGTDLLDIMRLTLDRQAGPIARQQLSTADDRIARDAQLHVQWCFGKNAQRSLALINAIPEGARVEFDDLQLVGELLSSASRRA